MALDNLIVGTSSLQNIYPRFIGTKVLDKDFYGLASTRVSDSIDKDPTEQVANSIIAAFRWAAKNKVQVWILPELCLDKIGLRHLVDLMRNNASSLKMVLAGSTYISLKTGGFVNQAKIITTQPKLEMFTYNKTIPFNMQIDTESSVPDIYKISNDAAEAKCNFLKEDFVPGEKLLILPLDGLKVGIAICKDVLDPFDARNPLAAYIREKVDIMLVTSMNSGHTNLFTATAEAMARWHNCATFYVNNLTSVSNAADKTVEMSFALLPNHTKIDGVQGCIYYRTAPTLNAIDGLSTVESDTVVENIINTIISRDVVAKALPSDGNVLYTIKNGMLEK